MPVLTERCSEQLDRDGTALLISEITRYLQNTVGQRVTAHLAGLKDPKQIGRYINHPVVYNPSAVVEDRLRAGYKIVRMFTECFDEKTARAWLFGTNSRLNDEAPITLLSEASTPKTFTTVIRAARQVAHFHS